jgi:hypothetical protein
MKTRKLTAIVLSAAFASALIVSSAGRAEAHRGWGGGWGWGIGAGIASALILGGIYHHRHHYGYYGGYPYYSSAYYPVYRYRYYRPRYYSYGYYPAYGYRYHRPHWGHFVGHRHFHRHW